MQARAAQPWVATWSSAQATSHAPQCAGSTAVSAQNAAPAAPQVASGAPQVAPHTPAEHTCPAPHAVPHAPQWPRSVVVFTSQPSDGSALQSAEPVAHAITTQAPTAHALVACGSAHARPQPPQCVPLVSVLVSQPLLATPSQSP